MILDPPVDQMDEYAALARAISSDGKLVAWTNKFEGTVRLCDARTGQALRSLKGLAKTGAGGEPGVAFSPDSARLAATNGDGTVIVWDTSSGQELLSFKAHTVFTLGLAFSPDGARLATAGRGNSTEVKLWDTDSGQELRVISSGDRLMDHRLMDHSVRFLAFSPDWKRLALNGFLLDVRDGSGGKLHAYVHENRDWVPSGQGSASVQAMTFSPDGVHVAFGYTSGKVDLRHAGTGRVVKTLQGHAGSVDAVTFSPDGKRLATGHRDGTVKLWDMTSLQLVRTLKGHTRVVRSVGFSKDGTLLMSAALDGTVRLWDARPLTPDLSVELEAVALLDSLFARPLSRSAVKSIVGDRLNIDSDVQQRALDLADLYAEETDPLRYYVSAWPVLRHPYANESMTETALAQTTAASKLHGMPEEARKNGGAYGNYFNEDGKVILQKTTMPGDYLFLGIAHYRMGRFKKDHYKEALAILSKCQQHRPTTLAFLAMTHHQLGQHEQAEAVRTRLREAVKTAGPDQARDGQVFLAEAETLIRR